MSNVLQIFDDILHDAGILPRGEIITDGIIHRCGTNDKPNGTDGAYIAHLDPPATIWFMNWKTGYTDSCSIKTERSMTDAERHALRKRIEANKASAKAERAKLQAEAATRANVIWDAAPAAPADHPYLKKKQVFSLGLRLATDGRLIVSVLDESCNIVSLQFIAGDGGKLFLEHGRTAGCFFCIPAKDESKAGPLMIAEGYATAASIHEATGYVVFVAFNAGNLLAVAQMARRWYPEREIILCADRDSPTDKYRSPGGVGLAKATEAARAISGMLAIPRREGHDKLDFNDLSILMGTGEVLHQILARRTPEPLPDTSSQEAAKDKLPTGFSIRKGGLWHTEIKEGADPVETFIGPELTVNGMTRDEHSNAWGLLLSWSDPDGIKHTWAMPRDMLVGRDPSAWLGRLASEGYAISPNSRAKNLLALFLSSYKTTKRARCVPRTGWHDDTYVFPDKTYYPLNLAGHAGHAGQRTDDAGLSPSSSEGGVLDVLDKECLVLQFQTAHNFSVAGTLDLWRKTIGILSQGNSRLMLGICTALAAPLLELCGMESGGINFVGGSSTGKTTALVISASIWGKGTSSGGYVQNWRATSNGLEGIAALHSDALLCLDELGQASGRTIAEASYMLANGMGKSRAYVDGSAKTAKFWRLLVLSSGEVGLADKIREEGGTVRAGQAVRLVDIPADAGAGMGVFEDLHEHANAQVFSDVLKKAAVTNYGHAARAFIEHIQDEGRDNVAAEVREFLDNNSSDLCPHDADGQVRRVARRFLLCAAAGELAADWGILPWNEGESIRAVRTCFEAWLSARGGAGAAEDTEIIEDTMLFLEQHGQSRFQKVDDPEGLCINRAGFRKQLDGGMRYYILPENFKAEVCKKHNATHAAAVLFNKGLLLRGDSRSYTKKPETDLPGWGRKRCYILDLRAEA